eukprot:scaffold28681_cov129-Isochrysis_galbana.AAC.2
MYLCAARGNGTVCARVAQPPRSGRGCVIGREGPLGRRHPRDVLRARCSSLDEEVGKAFAISMRNGQRSGRVPDGHGEGRHHCELFRYGSEYVRQPPNLSQSLRRQGKLLLRSLAPL